MNRTRGVLAPSLIATGLLALGDQLGLVHAWELLTSWWPVALLLLGVVQLTGRPRNTVGGAFTLLLGGGLLAYTLGIVSSLAVLWALLLIGLGVWLLVGSPRSPSVQVTSASELLALFDDRDLRYPAGPFHGGTATTVFGDLDLDLSAATLPDEGATLQVTTVFGDVDVTIPAGWAVQVDGPELFGSVRVPPPPDPSSTAPVLRLRATTVFGDLEVRAVAVAAPAATG